MGMAPPAACSAVPPYRDRQSARPPQAGRARRNAADTPASSRQQDHARGLSCLSCGESIPQLARQPTGRSPRGSAPQSRRYARTSDPIRPYPRGFSAGGIPDDGPVAELACQPRRTQLAAVVSRLRACCRRCFKAIARARRQPASLARLALPVVLRTSCRAGACLVMRACLGASGLRHQMVRAACRKRRPWKARRPRHDGESMPMGALRPSIPIARQLPPLRRRRRAAARCRTGSCSRPAGAPCR